MISDYFSKEEKRVARKSFLYATLIVLVVSLFFSFPETIIEVCSVIGIITLSIAVISIFLFGFIHLKIKNDPRF